MSAELDHPLLKRLGKAQFWERRGEGRKWYIGRHNNPEDACSGRI